MPSTIVILCLLLLVYPIILRATQALHKRKPTWKETLRFFLVEIVNYPSPGATRASSVTCAWSGTMQTVKTLHTPSMTRSETAQLE